MANGFYPKIEITGRIQKEMSDVGFTPMRNLDSTDGVQSSSFKDVMSGLAGNLNQNINAPDKLLREAMAGNTDVDIHDVMTAMAKADISVNVATQVTSKVIQAYDKIMQISV